VAILIDLFAVDEVWLEDALEILRYRQVVINNDVLPHIFLKDLDQIYSKLVDFERLEHSGESALAILDAIESVCNKMTIQLALYIYVTPLIPTGDHHFLVLVKL
jgi:hypothetical protein